MPFACSGDMYAAVPSIIPRRSSAGIVMVGDCERSATNRADGSMRLRQAEVQHLHDAVGAHLDVRGLQIAMDDALLVRGFERLGDLLRDLKRLVDRDRAARNALRQIVALDEFHHERRDARALFEAVDGGDVRMIQRGEDFGFAMEPCEPIVVSGERWRQDLDGDLRFSFVSVARYTSPMPPTPISAVISYAPRRVPGVRAKWRDYMGLRD